MHHGRSKHASSYVKQAKTTITTSKTEKTAAAGTFMDQAVPSQPQHYSSTHRRLCACVGVFVGSAGWFARKSDVPAVIPQ
ncbi:hypothetical protein Y032_0442g1546 [Ancylostoma ceylanicum]|uniref:Uncharacterized protein n=1 Tax=Ancylostoma ceylanicum TaxID=53326 RepID=A0A016X0K9_9BILA|nr:hypothetical protein Y032_0442g1546 [Ancylostoma ceylanicum]